MLSHHNRHPERSEGSLYFANAVIAACLMLGTIANAQPTTIRIRFVDGKTGQPLKLKYYTVSASGDKYYDYTIDKIEQNALVVTFPHSTSFSFGNDAYLRCDTTKQSSPPLSYNLQQILDQGIVSPNVCGPFHAQPTKGELVIYSHHEHWWQFIARLPKGLICA